MYVYTLQKVDFFFLPFLMLPQLHDIANNYYSYHPVQWNVGIQWVLCVLNDSELGVIIIIT